MKAIFIYLLHIVFVKCTETQDSKSDGKFPIVLVPGFGGSQALVKLNGKPSQTLNLWINIEYLFFTKYLKEYFKLEYDSKLKIVKETAKNAEIVFPGWGDTWSIENLDKRKHYATVYYQYLVEAITIDPYYIRNKTLRGAPFDFRKHPGQNPNFLTKLKSLIEETYIINGRRPIVLVGHSMGSLYAVYFFNKMSFWWKKTFIRTFVSASAPLAGSVKSMKAFTHGDNFGLVIRSPETYRNILRTMPSIPFMFPDKRVWNKNEILIKTPEVNYSTENLDQYFKDVGVPEAYQIMLDGKHAVDGFTKPSGIDDIYCVYGTDIATVSTMEYYPETWYRNGFPKGAPTEHMGKGDGTVNDKSLEICRKWNDTKIMKLKHAEHFKILSDHRFIRFIQNISGASISHI